MGFSAFFPVLGFLLFSFFSLFLFRRHDRSFHRDPGKHPTRNPDPLPTILTIPAPYASEGESPVRHDLTLTEFATTLTLCAQLLLEPYGSWVPLFSELLWSAVTVFAAPLCYSAVLFLSFRLELAARHRNRRHAFTGRAPKFRGARRRRIRGELKCPRRSRGRLRYPCPHRHPERTGRRGAKLKRLNEIFWVELLSAYADVRARNRFWKKIRCLWIPLYRGFMILRRLFQKARLVREDRYDNPPDPDPEPDGPDWAEAEDGGKPSNPFRVYSPDEVEAMRSVAEEWFDRRDTAGTRACVDDDVSLSSCSTVDGTAPCSSISTNAHDVALGARQDLVGSVIWDSGASAGVTPHASDFLPGTLKPLKSTVVQGMATGLAATHSGVIAWKIPAEDGSLRTFRLQGLLVPQCKYRLLSQHRRT